MKHREGEGRGRSGSPGEEPGGGGQGGGFSQGVELLLLSWELLEEFVGEILSA